MSVQIVFTGNTASEALADMRCFFDGLPPTNRTVEVIDQPAPPTKADAAEQMTLTDPEGQTYGVYDDEKALVGDFLEMIAAAENIDDLTRLGNNNEILAYKLKKANGNKITKAFTGRRKALAVAGEAAGANPTTAAPDGPTESATTNTESTGGRAKPSDA